MSAAAAGAAPATRAITGADVARGRRRRAVRGRAVTAMLGAVVLAAVAVSLMVGDTWYGPGEVLRVMIAGETVPGASFTIGELRLPRACLGVLAGFSFGAAGAAFQTLLRNPLASPDIIGVSGGAAAAAVLGIVVLGWSDTAVSALALCGALATAIAIYLLANRRGFTGARFILIGIGIAAMLQSVISYLLSRSAVWDMQEAMQWITGSLNSASWDSVLPLALVCAVCAPALLVSGRRLGVLGLGDDAATALGVRVDATRITVIVSAVVLLAFATAAAGPIAFVAFMSGPIAARLTGPAARPLVPAGLVGAALVLVADLVGQFLFDTRYPVGVVTGALGAPYLIFLLTRLNRSGGAA